MEDEYEDEFKDPLLQNELQQIYEEERIKSINFVYDLIEDVGIETWVKGFSMEPDRKINIMNNMIDFFIEMEEYEKCSVIVKGINLIKD